MIERARADAVSHAVDVVEQRIQRSENALKELETTVRRGIDPIAGAMPGMPGGNAWQTTQDQCSGQWQCTLCLTIGECVWDSQMYTCTYAWGVGN